MFNGNRGFFSGIIAASFFLCLAGGAAAEGFSDSGSVIRNKAQDLTADSEIDGQGFRISVLRNKYVPTHPSRSEFKKNHGALLAVLRKKCLEKFPDVMSIEFVDCYSATNYEIDQRTAEILSDHAGEQPLENFSTTLAGSYSVLDYCRDKAQKDECSYTHHLMLLSEMEVRYHEAESTDSITLSCDAPSERIFQVKYFASEIRSAVLSENGTERSILLFLFPDHVTGVMKDKMGNAMLQKGNSFDLSLKGGDELHCTMKKGSRS